MNFFDLSVQLTQVGMRALHLILGVDFYLQIYVVHTEQLHSIILFSIATTKRTSIESIFINEKCSKCMSSSIFSISLEEIDIIKRLNHPSQSFL